MSRPPFIIATEDVPEEDGTYPDSTERLFFGRAIGRAAGMQRLGLHVERVPPGRRTSYPHAEGDEEEWVYVLEGEVDAWIDGALHRMRKSDLAAFACGTGICHVFLNNGNQDALLLVGGERSRPDSRIFYPLNPERQAQVKPERWWHDIPLAPQGDHDGRAGNRLGRRAAAWAAQLRAEGVALPPERVSSWCFGDSPDLARELAALVVARVKTATAALHGLLGRDRLPQPQPGDLSIVTQFDGTPVCLIETTHVEVLPFHAVGAEFAAAEGEGDRSLAYWRHVHWDYFSRECAAIGIEMSEESLVLNERFRLLRIAA